MRKLIAFILLMAGAAMAQTPSFRNFDTNGFNIVSNGVPLPLSNAGAYWISNLWVNEVYIDGYRTLRPADQSRIVQTYSSSSNDYALRVYNAATNTPTNITAGAISALNLPAAAGTNAIYGNAGQVGVYGETRSQSGGSLIPGDAVGVLGLAQVDWSMQIGVLGLGWGNVSATTNIGGAFSGLRDLTGKSVGMYAETANFFTTARSPVIDESAVTILNSKQGTDPIIIGQSNSVQVFRVNQNGNLAEIRDVPYEWPTTNASTGQGLASTSGGQLYWTNFGTGGGGAAIGPGTELRHAMFVSSTNVGDSVLFQPATNQLEMKLTNSSYSTVVSNLWYGANTNATGWRATSLMVDPSGYTTLDQLLGSAVSPATFPRSGFIFNNAWIINGYGSSATGDGGGKVPHWLPNITDAFDVGTSSSRVRSFWSGAAGFNASDAAANGRNFLGSTYGIGCQAGGIGFYLNSGPNFIAGMSRTADGIYNLSINNTYLAGGPNAGNGFGVDTFMTRGFQAGSWQFGTNNSSGTAQPIAYMHGGSANGTDKPGDAIFLANGLSTGTGTPGAVGIATAEAATASGSSANSSFYPRIYVSPKVVTLTTNTATTVFSFSIPTSMTSVGGFVKAMTESKDGGTNIVTINEMFSISALREGANTFATNCVSAPLTKLSRGTADLTTTWTVVTNTTSIDVKCNAVTSGVGGSYQATSTKTRWRFEPDSSAVTVITP